MLEKVKHHNTNLVRNDLESAGCLLDFSVNVKINLLNGMIKSQAEILEQSNHPESLIDVHRKQNLSCGLTNISDNVFDFFLYLETKRLPLYSAHHLEIHGPHLLQHVHTTIQDDPALFDVWVSLFGAVDSVVMFHGTDNDDCASVLDDIFEGTVAVLDLFKAVTDSYLKVCDAEFRKKIIEDLGKKKAMEHRKSVLIRKEQKKKGSLSLATLQTDVSQGNEAGHLKLKGSVMLDKAVLPDFTKKYIITIGKSYGLTLSLSKKKDILVEQLSGAIMQNDTMPFP